MSAARASTEVRSAAVVQTAPSAIVSPPAACPCWYSGAGQPFPVDAITCSCPRCLTHLRLLAQSRRWNQDHTHQAASGKARARAFTREYQQQSGYASFVAFSARWWASQGLPPLSAEAVRVYLTPEHIREALGLVIEPAMQHRIYRAWCAWALYGVPWWRTHPDAAAALDQRLDQEAAGWCQAALLEVADREEAGRS
jgi:hypothetical protein